MKKIILTLMAILAVNLYPALTFAQPQGEGWYSLDQITSSYERNFLRVGQFAEAECLVIPQGTVKNDKYEFLRPVYYISQIAYKPIESSSEKGSIRIAKITGFEGNGKPIIDKNKIIINNKFDIKHKTYEDGWEIYNLNGLGLIEQISPSGNRGQISNTGILDNFYVQIVDPSQSQKEAKRQAANQSIEATKAAMKGVYSTPQQQGWTPIKVENLDDGTIIEHYNEGVRFIKKPNGDFASFIEPEDSRDPKTLDLIKGIDKSLNNNDNIIGAYQFTFEEGVVASSDGVFDKYLLEDGDILELNNISNDKWNIKKKENHKNIQYTIPFFNITYGQFIGNEAIDFHIPAEYRVQDNTPILQAFKYIKGEEVFDIDAYIERDNRDLKKSLMINNYIIEINPKSYNTVGIATDKFYFPTEQLFTNVSKNGDILRVEFANGDFVEFDEHGKTYGVPFRELKMTFRDGTILEQIMNNTLAKQRIFYPDGSKFVGNLNNRLVEYNLVDWFNQNPPNFPYYEGYIYDADGNESHFNLEQYKYQQQQKEKEEREKMAMEYIQKELYPKYGKANVNAAIQGNLKIGMKIQMLIELGIGVIKDDQGSTYTWYKVPTDITYNGTVKYRWVKVNNSTGRIDYISAQKSGGFMSY